MNTVEVSPGGYFKFNVLDGITSSSDLVSASFESRDVVLKIKIGCEGMPLSKSTNSQFWPIEIAGLCCDAPALSLIKLVKYGGAYYCCMKSETEGKYVFNDSGRGWRVTFPIIDALNRTDESFRNRDQIFHHLG